jgi:hypothetical protein
MTRRRWDTERDEQRTMPGTRVLSQRKQTQAILKISQKIYRTATLQTEVFKKVSRASCANRRDEKSNESEGRKQ